MAYAECFAHYLAAWNEPEPSKIFGHLERAVAIDVWFVDPANQVQGIRSIEQLIREAHEAMDAEYVRISGIDGHNRRYRYLWEVRREGQPAIPGMDFTTVNEAGLIERIDGFFGDFPPHE